MVLFLLGLIGLTLLIYLVLRALTSRGTGTVKRAPVAPPRPPDDDEDFLRDLRRRADEQRRRAQDPRDD